MNRRIMTAVESSRAGRRAGVDRIDDMLRLAIGVSIGLTIFSVLMLVLLAIGLGIPLQEQVEILRQVDGVALLEGFAMAERQAERAPYYFGGGLFITLGLGVMTTTGLAMARNRRGRRDA